MSEVGLPTGGTARVAGVREVFAWQPFWLHGFAQQWHLCLFRRHIAFFIVAWSARGHHVVPFMLATFTDRKHVIDGQNFFRKSIATVLTNMIVAEKQVLP